MQQDTKSIPLSEWATIAEVSNALNVKEDTIRRAVEKACTLQQDWVKQEAYPGPDSSLRWLIDTSHPTYQCHEQRWRTLAEKTKPEHTMGSHNEMVFFEEEPDVLACEEEAEAMPSCALSEAQQQLLESAASWEVFFHWLAQRGLVVFVNKIDTDQKWRWSWRNHAGSGYANETAAIIAALRYQLLFGEPLLSPASPMPDPAATPTEPGRSFWKWLARRTWSRIPTNLE